ncbi:MAG: AAA family ATPase [Desulfobacteraceae bacterium]|jgi:predicted ATPase
MDELNSMIKLKIKNIGPIKDGIISNDDYIDINEVTVFIGNQGSGKSTIAKVFSTLSWIEKALVRGDFTTDYISQYNRFKKHFAYQGISNYFNNSSLIEYIGNAYRISYNNSRLVIEENNPNTYKFPKIMYVPAERNFVSSVDRPDLVKRLPLPLYTFLDEYEEAKINIGNGVILPIGKVTFEYRKQHKKSLLVGPDFKIELLEASSGFQSLVPLFIVTKHLSRIIRDSGNTTHKEISVDEEKKIRKEIDKIFGNANISDDIKSMLLEKLSARFKYSSFLNIVEEPEQNLYPISQKEILFELLNSKNDFTNNKLIITTHSPYIINYLTLAVKADFVKNKLQGNSNSQELLEELSTVVPLSSTINSSSLSIYQLENDGSINRLPDYNGLPNDENYLNEFLAESNDLFIKLMEIEDKCQ